MAFKRALWSSGYEYRAKCPYCATDLIYRDNQLDYRPWFPNGFIYCPKCRKPFRHNEIFAVNADGTPVYKTQEEANNAINIGFYGAEGVNTQVQTQSPAPAAINDPPVQRPQPVAAPSQSVTFCPRCGRAHTKGSGAFCSACGNKLE